MFSLDPLDHRYLRDQNRGIFACASIQEPQAVHHFRILTAIKEGDEVNLYLIGYRGSGKTTVGSRLALRLNLPHYDSDDLVEGQSGQTIEEIFTAQGEAEFRRLEAEVIRTLHHRSPAVISLGGGTILFPESRDRLRASGKMVWLKASAGLLHDRIEQDLTSQQRRPRLTDLGRLAEVEAILKQREPIYSACADLTVDVEELSADQVAETIFRWWTMVDTESVSHD